MTPLDGIDPPSFPGLPRRPMLRPGVHVVRRSHDELQVGLSEDLAVVLPDRPEVRALLQGLQQGQAPAAPHDDTGLPHHVVATASARLLARGLVVDGDHWSEALGGDDPERAAAVSAIVAEHGLAARTTLRRRADTTVAVDCIGLPRAAQRLEDLLAANGLRVVPPRRSALVVVMRRAEVDRSDLDHLARSDTPHVLLRVTEGRVRVGPFVHPGLTACLRCLDAHRLGRDPRHGLVLQQYVEAGPGGACGLPEPVPADLLDVAVGVVARDVTRWADGDQPVTWSTTVDVDPDLGLPRVLWTRHPGCGCSWAGSATVGPVAG